jgi:hypothetical protein
MSTRSLICEGECNPARIPLEEEVRSFRKRDGRVYGGVSLPVETGLAASLRALLHTPHRIVTEELARCNICHGARRHGKVS